MIGCFDEIVTMMRWDGTKRDATDVLDVHLRALIKLIRHKRLKGMMLEITLLIRIETFTQMTYAVLAMSKCLIITLI